MLGQDVVRDRDRGDADFALDRDEGEQHVVDVRARVLRAADAGDPGRVGHAGFDEGREAVHQGPGVGLEEAGVDLRDDVAYGFGFVGELDGKGGLEVGE